MEVLTQREEKIFKKIAMHRMVFLQIVGGALFLAALSQLQIPLHPIPITLQTLGVFLLAIGQGGEKSAGSVLLYLVFAALGLPVLAGGTSHPLWILSPSAGYLMGFPIAAYVIGKRRSFQKTSSPLSFMKEILVGTGIILTLGVAYLNRFLSFPDSLSVGFFPFLPVEGIKCLFASSISTFYYRCKEGNEDERAPLF